MVKKHSPKIKHVPQRTCVGCKKVLPKRTLIRIVRSPDGVLIDQTGKANGRGAYLHDHKSCWQEALKGSLSRALQTELTAKDWEVLLQFASGLSDEVMTED